MMISKGSFTTLVQVTAVNTGARASDVRRRRLAEPEPAGRGLGQPAGAERRGAGQRRRQRPTYHAHPHDHATTSTRRIDPTHPRLVRRINNGHPTTFNNTLGTAVAIDIENLQFTYDISNGTNNPGDVKMVAADLTGTGACAPDAVRADADPQDQRDAHRPVAEHGDRRGMRFCATRSQSQVSLRGMAFVDRVPLTAGSHAEIRLRRGIR